LTLLVYLPAISKLPVNVNYESVREHFGAIVKVQLLLYAKELIPVLIPAVLDAVNNASISVQKDLTIIWELVQVFVTNIELTLMNNSLVDFMKLFPLDASQNSSVGHRALYSNLVMNNYLWPTEGRTEPGTSGTQGLITITVHSQVQQRLGVGGVEDGLLRIYSWVKQGRLVC
jgi:hypothetical protein